MDKTQETNIRLTLVVKSIEVGGLANLDLDKIDQAVKFIAAPLTNQIVKATAIVNG